LKGLGGRVGSEADDTDNGESGVGSRGGVTLSKSKKAVLDSLRHTAPVSRASRSHSAFKVRKTACYGLFETTGHEPFQKIDDEPL